MKNQIEFLDTLGLQYLMPYKGEHYWAPGEHGARWGNWVVTISDMRTTFLYHNNEKADWPDPWHIAEQFRCYDSRCNNARAPKRVRELMGFIKL